jgi:hypothetical protein
MRTIGLLLAITLLFAGCKKNQELPTHDGSSNNVRTSEFSVTSDSPKFIIPIEMMSGAKEITATGRIITSLAPEYSSYVVLSVGDSVVWHSSFMEASVEFKTKDLKRFITGTGVECTLEFFNIPDVHGPFKCSGSILFTYNN